MARPHARQRHCDITRVIFASVAAVAVASAAGLLQGAVATRLGEGARRVERANRASAAPPQLARYSSVTSSAADDLQALFALPRGPEGGTRWLGGDAATSLEAGAQRQLWLFGDTLLGGFDASHQQRRRGVQMPHQSAALQRLTPGTKPVAGDLTFHWRTATPSGAHAPEAVSLVNPRANASFYCSAWPVTQHGCSYLWAISGAVEAPRAAHPGRMLVLAAEITSSTDSPMGFAVLGTTAVVVSDASVAPSEWRYTATNVPFATPTESWWTAIANASDDGTQQSAPDVMYLVGANTEGTVLARGRLSDLVSHRWTEVEFWAASGAAGEPSWVKGRSNVHRLQTLLPNGPVPGPSEASLVWEPRLRLWLLPVIPSLGSDVTMWSAPTPTGPWEPRHGVYTIPPPGPKYFCYAPKLHPHLAAPTGGWDGRASHGLVEIVMTYVCNAWNVTDLFAPQTATHYVPTAVRIQVDMSAGVESGSGGGSQSGSGSGHHAGGGHLSETEIAILTVAGLALVGVILALIVRWCRRQGYMGGTHAPRGPPSQAALPRDKTYKWENLNSASSFSDAETQAVVSGPAAGTLVEEESFSYVRM